MGDAGGLGAGLDVELGEDSRDVHAGGLEARRARQARVQWSSVAGRSLRPPGARPRLPPSGPSSFDGSRREGDRMPQPQLQPHPEHEAPDADCTCGLYSLRRPRSGWALDHRLATGSIVCGAVASIALNWSRSTGSRRPPAATARRCPTRCGPGTAQKPRHHGDAPLNRSLQ